MAPLWRDSAPVTSALAALLQDVWGAGGGLQQQQAARVVDPDLLITALARADDRWGDGTQQDCQELLLSLLALLQDEGNRVRRKPNRPKQRDTMGDEALLAAAAAADDAAWCSSAAGDVLGGQLQSTVTCGHCGCRSHTFEAVNGSLLLPLPKQQQQQAWQQQQQAWQPAAARRRGGGKQPLAAVLPVQRPVTVAGLLQAFCAGEVLRGEEAYRCGQCGAVTEASKRLQLYVEQPSPLLALAAKRFDSGQEPGSAGGGSKVSTPLLMDASAHVLDLTPFCNPAGLAAAAARGLPRPVYELVAVADHAGSLGRGHYTARVRSPVDGRWRAFNDEAVTLLEGAPSGCDSAPYMLFYRLRQQ
jgi:ubiquitin carboxyl-terminal hydrolase 2/21